MEAVVGAEPIVSSASSEGVPRRASDLYQRYDKNKDGRLSYDEIRTALLDDFADMPAYANEQMRAQFDKYASADGFLDLRGFNTLYAAFLFRYFDVNGDGVLDLTEAERALAFLSDGASIAVALPTEVAHGEQKVSKMAFWRMYLAMME